MEQMEFDFAKHPRKSETRVRYSDDDSFIYDKNGKTPYMHHSEAEHPTYPVRKIEDGTHLFLVEDDYGVEHPYSIGHHRIKNPSFNAYMKCDEYYILWAFKDNSAAIERRKAPGTFVSELWELRNAVKRLGMDLLMDFT